MLLSTAIEGFLIARRAGGYSPNTIAIFKNHARQLVEFTHDPELSALQLRDLQTYLVYLQDELHLSTSSVRNAWCTLRSFFRWAEEELQHPRPDLALKCPRVVYPEIQPFTPDEIKRLIKAAGIIKTQDTERWKSFSMRRHTALRDIALILLLLDTGLRASEVTRLQIKHINLETGSVFVVPWGTGKKTKSRHVYLGQSAVRALWRYLASRKAHPEEFLFTTTNHTGLDRNLMQHTLRNIGDRAGVPHCHPHRFRHTFAIFYLRGGGDVFTLQKLLGHSSLDMVRHYLSIAESDLQNAHRIASPVDRLRL